MAFVKKNHDHSHLSDTQLAWAAGFVDGEGCITTATNGPCGSVHMVQISVGNTDRKAIELFKKWFKCGNISRHSHTNPNWRDLYTWLVRAKGAEEVIRVLQPFLRLKHKQAALALQLRAIVNSGKGTTAQKGQLAKRLRSFNGRRSVQAKKGGE